MGRPLASRKTSEVAAWCVDHIVSNLGKGSSSHREARRWQSFWPSGESCGLRYEALQQNPEHQSRQVPNEEGLLVSFIYRRLSPER